ncbi:lycopene beta-cyclase CrtY [Sphingobium subterraneum]|uniref:Lycopene beta-cyclase n=1 Tax=Sphingobium subterraneum TaxID=627688 RepID=A0A841J213_9SPHN|nr:lycopene beta-cyclase [Sphingobium subterraneum]
MIRSPSSELSCDLAIVGGGLAGGLIALAFARLRPEVSVLLIEGADTLGGNHVWSFFDSDIPARDRWLIDPMIVHRWPSGHDVRFPGFARTLTAGYNSITSARFDKHVRAMIGKGVHRGAVTEIRPDGVTLENGTTITAKGVIDARGFFTFAREPETGDACFMPRDPTRLLPQEASIVTGPATSVAGPFLCAADTRPPDPLASLDCGWQKFLGQTLRLSAPHGLTRPIIMDATVEQIDGYRFVYVLPTGDHDLFVEDTYYSDDPHLDAAAIRTRIAAYAGAQSWRVEVVTHEETGVLPVVIGGDFDRFWPRHDPVARAGVRAGMFHPTTGYSLPHAVSFALDIAAMERLDGPSLALATRALAQAHWRCGSYYRLLDTMLFRAAQPAERWRIFARFYRLSEPLIARFYAGRSAARDKLRILCGRPPVPIRAAMHALWKRARP